MSDLLVSTLRTALYTPSINPVFDSAKNHENADVILDDVDSYILSSIAQDAIAALHSWVEMDSDDLDEDETNAERLASLFVGIADANKDGELDDDEQEVIEEALNAAWDYLEHLGVDENDISALFNDWDEDAALRIYDLISSSLPEGEDEEKRAIDDFVFGDDQGAVFDATYAKRTVVRKGKRVRINKRIAGKVRLSPKQKLAIRKMHRKSHSPKARARRLKSMKISRRMK